ALGDRAGAVVVVEPATGDVLVLVSAPSFDPNDLDRERFAQLSADDRRPLLNRALAGLYPPASTYKAVTAAAALAAGWGPGTTVDVPPGGFIPPGETQPIRD
ncbi:MAG TPA: penicillin-binding protein 2, partial [Armatimonadetes bacterium]|nr:penicillin-binding protein 2 [Armatimonadota bacterium]